MGGMSSVNVMRVAISITRESMTKNSRYMLSWMKTEAINMTRAKTRGPPNKEPMNASFLFNVTEYAIWPLNRVISTDIIFH